MNKNDRLLIGALVLGVWALVAMQFFGGMTASAAAQERGTIGRPLYVNVVNEANVYCTNCDYPTEVWCANCD